MAEFTGERVIPGLVDIDLFNEHVSRYKFAARLVPEGAAVLDMGCGTGYGSAELTKAGSIVGVDVAPEAVAHARANYGREGVTFLEASCAAIPLPDQRFDVITAFEVIEHLENWRGLLEEARRLLRQGGQFVVSTPNKSYYAETRGETGPNPFHAHEFEYGEFESALREFFPHVRIWTQNHAAAIVFAPGNAAGASLAADGTSAPEEAHFFVAVCSSAEISASDVFAWVPQSGNLLREREAHIAKLEGELAQKDAWLTRSVEAHGALQREHEATLEELRAKNRWAESLNTLLAEQAALITSLQKEAEEQLGWVRQLEARIAGLEDDIRARLATEARLENDLAARTNWAHGLERELAEKVTHVRLLLDEVAENTASLGHLQNDLAALRAERQAVADSRWLRLGQTLHLGPELRTDK